MDGRHQVDSGLSETPGAWSQSVWLCTLVAAVVVATANVGSETDVYTWPAELVGFDDDATTLRVKARVVGFDDADALMQDTSIADGDWVVITWSGVVDYADAIRAIAPYDAAMLADPFHLPAEYESAGAIAVLDLQRHSHRGVPRSYCVPDSMRMGERHGAVSAREGRGRHQCRTVRLYGHVVRTSVATTWKEQA